MSTINFTRNRLCKQRLGAVRPGFLCIELLQGLLILGVLLLLVSAFHVLSVHWQHQAIKRFEALDLLSSELAGAHSSNASKGIQAIKITSHIKSRQVPELATLIGKSIAVEQKVVHATWHDERGNQHTMMLVS